MVLLRAKCIIVGNSKAGKTSIVQVYQSEGAQFPHTYSMTAGVETSVKTIQIPGTASSVELYLIDVSGNELYSDLASKCWDNPSMLVLVYDVTELQSLASCPMWLEQVRSQKPEIAFPGVLLANKIDLTKRQVVTAEDGRGFAESKGLSYFETSAKDIKGIDEAFNHLATEYYKLYQDKIASLIF